MSLSRISVAAIGLGLVVLYAAGSGFWVSGSDQWYRSLNAPSWQPPDWVFGVIWPYNFIVLGITAVLVSQSIVTYLYCPYPLSTLGHHRLTLKLGIQSAKLIQFVTGRAIRPRGATYLHHPDILQFE